MLLLVLALNAHGQMYKCVDERGKVNYTDKPQPGCKEAAIKGSPPISGALRQRNEDLGAEEREFRRRQLQQQAKDTKEQQALTQRCARLRQERAALTSGRRLSKVDAKGERVFMDDTVRDQRLVQVDEQLRGCP
jgi:hypothetical protein